MSKLVVLFFASAVVIATVLYSCSKAAGSDRSAGYGRSAAVASSTALWLLQILAPLNQNSMM